MERTLALGTRITGAWLIAATAPLLAVRLDQRLAPSALVELGKLMQASPGLAAAGWVALLIASLLLARRGLDLWFNRMRPWLSREAAPSAGHAFPVETLDLINELRTAKPETYFVGRTPKAKRFTRGTTVTLTDKQRTMHVHCVGQTGSGKSASVLFPLALQDALAGKAIIIMDAKGSAENLQAITNIAAAAGRLNDLRIFSLPFPERSHTYNPFWLTPRSASNPAEGDPLAVAERIFSVFKTEMEEPFYRNTSDVFLRSIIRVLHGMVDGTGASIPFTANDVLACLQTTEVLDYCCERTLDRDAAEDIEAQIRSLGALGRQAFAGLLNLVQAYTVSPILNASAPDIVISEVLEKRQIVYFQLPANFYGQLTQSIGKIVLQELQQAGARRQLDRSLDQTPVGIFIDEFYNFAYLGFIDALNKLRDSRLQFFLAHQSLSDLERVSKEFAAGIWDNTRTKVVLYQNNALLCDQISKGIGTYPAVKVTTRQSVGDLAVKINLGEQSAREVEEFRLHPNAIKSLAPCGQAYLIESNNHVAINLAQLPAEFFEPWPGIGVSLVRRPQAGLKLRELGRTLPKQAGAK